MSFKAFKDGLKDTKKINTDAVTLSDKDLLSELVERQVGNPFPMDVFPDAFHDYIQFLTGDIELEPCFVGLSMIQAVSIAIGSGLRGQMGLMVEKPCVYGCLVGYTSSGKSFALDMCMKPIAKHQKMLDAINEEEPMDTIGEFEKDKEGGRHYREHVDETKALFVKDATFDAFIQLLTNNPKGVTRYYDEFYSYFVDIERLKVNAGDITFWTEKWNSQADHRVKRKSKKAFFIPSETLFCNIFGGTQPDFLKYFFSKGKLEQGFSWRFLYAIQPKYNIAEVSAFLDFPDEAYAKYESTIDKVFDRFKVFTHGRMAEVIKFDKAGKDIYEAWRKAARAKVDMCDDVIIKNARAGIYGKMKQYVIRFATILQVMHECSYVHEPNIFRIDAIYVQMAVRLANYFIESNFLAYQIVYENLVVPPEVKRLAMVLKKHYWNRTTAAKELEVNRGTLIRYINKYSRQYPTVFETKNNV
jgi:DNA-binding protein Fis